LYCVSFKEGLLKLLAQIELCGYDKFFIFYLRISLKDIAHNFICAIMREIIL